MTSTPTPPWDKQKASTPTPPWDKQKESTPTPPWDDDDPYREFTEILSAYFMYAYEYNSECELHTASDRPALRTWCINLNLDTNPLNIVGDPSCYVFDTDFNMYVFDYRHIQFMYTECSTSYGVITTSSSSSSPSSSSLSTPSSVQNPEENVRSICENEARLLHILEYLNTELLMNFLEDNLGDDTKLLLPPLFMKVYDKAHAQFENAKKAALELRQALFRQQELWLMGYLSYSRNAVLYIDMHGAYFESLGTIENLPQTETPDGIPPLGRTFTHIHLTTPSSLTYCSLEAHLAAENVKRKWDWENQWADATDKVSALQKMSKTYTDVYVNNFPQTYKRDKHRMGVVRWYNMLDERDATARLLDKKFSTALKHKNK